MNSSVHTIQYIDMIFIWCAWQSFLWFYVNKMEAPCTWSVCGFVSHIGGVTHSLGFLNKRCTGKHSRRRRRRKPRRNWWIWCDDFKKNMFMVMMGYWKHLRSVNVSSEIESSHIFNCVCSKNVYLQYKFLLIISHENHSCNNWNVLMVVHESTTVQPDDGPQLHPQDKDIRYSGISYGR